METPLVHIFASLLLPLLGISTSSAATTRDPKSDMCEPIQVEECKGVGYNGTTLAGGNYFGHLTQDEVQNSTMFQEFAVLMKPNRQSSKCSIDFKLFVCGMFLPRCVNNRPMIPCKSTCTRVKNRCRGFYGSPSKWPAEMECEMRPYFNDKYDSCMLSTGNPAKDNLSMVMDFPSDEPDSAAMTRDVKFANCQCTCTQPPPPPTCSDNNP